MLQSWVGLSAVLCVAGLLLYVGAGGSVVAADEHSPRVAVNIENYAFSPDPITIAPGTTVVWTNRDEVAHTVVSNDKLFSSPELDANQHFEFTFKKAGTFPYFCSLHPEMKGKVIVK